MGVRRCIVVAQASDEGASRVLRQRLAALTGFYDPLGDPRLSERWLQSIQVLVGVIDLDDRDHDLSSPLVFGAELPVGLRSTEALLDADSSALRAVVGPLAAVAVASNAVRVITACGPPTMLYEAHGPDARVWSSHAVAAAYVARGTATLNTDVLAEFLAAEFVGGDRTLVRDAHAVDTAITITVSPAGVETKCFWPRSERWKLVDAEEAQEHAEDALMASLPARLQAYPRPSCGLTGGFDSRVVAVALTELGIDFEPFTFGESGWPDVQAAATVAQQLGISHRRCPIEWPGDAEMLLEARAATRWHEGAIHLGVGRIAWPDEISAWVTGSGGETGRAVYYRALTPRDEHPSLDQIRLALSSALLGRIEGAGDEAVAAVRGSLERWIVDARSLGLDGWRILDVVYAEQRVRRWLRGMLAHNGGVPIAAFTAPEVQRGLASLPLNTRVHAGFPRSYLVRHAPNLLPAEPRRPRTGQIALDRVWGHMRRALPPHVRARVRRALPGRNAASDSLLGERWSQYPRVHAWIADELLCSDLLAQALGERWSNEVRRGFVTGDGNVERSALWAAGPMALAEELNVLAR